MMAVFFITFMASIIVASSNALVRRELNSHALYTSSLAESIRPHQSQFPIDFVYCWAGEALQEDDERMEIRDIKQTDHNLGRGFGELRYSIRLLEAYAPWFNKVYILVNTPAERPTWLTEASKDKILMIDRCTLFERSQDCPTENDAACRAVMHKIPGLSQHFVAMDDDFLMLHPLKPSDFFASGEGKPLVLAAGAQKDWPMYGEKPPQGPDMPPKSVPTRMLAWHHLPCPLWVSFAWQLEHEYPEWFAFVRSHHTRFVCCNASIRGNGLDEEFHRIHPHMLLKLQVGIKRPERFSATCDNDKMDQAAFQQCLLDKLSNPRMKFMTLQNIFHLKTWAVVQDALKAHIKSMPESRLVVPLDLNELWGLHLPGRLQAAGGLNGVTFER